MRYFVERQNAYNALVSKRKECRACHGLGLINPACIEGNYDSNQIGPWSRWQGNLNAEIMVVGQDWGDIRYFTKWQGTDQPTGNPTNTNLQKLLQTFGVTIKEPTATQTHSIFLTNLILCIKKEEGGMQAPIQQKCYANCSEYFYQLAEIIRPQIIISLGKPASESILSLYRIPFKKTAPLSEFVDNSPYKLKESMYLFPMYHCGARGISTNRPLEKQMEDWRKAADWFKNTPCLAKKRETTSHAGL